MDTTSSLSYHGIREEFDFPSFYNCGGIGTRVNSNLFSALSPTQHHQRPDFQGKKYVSFSIISCRGVEICKLSTTLWFSRKGPRETIVICIERQPLFDSPKSLSFSREILGHFLTRGLRWGVETYLWGHLLVLKASDSPSLATSTSISLRTVINCNLEFGILIVSRIKLNPLHFLLILVAHGSQSLSEREGDFSMMIRILFHWCDKMWPSMLFFPPWKQTPKYFHTLFLMALYSIYNSYLDFLRKAFFLYLFFFRVSPSAMVNYYWHKTRCQCLHSSLLPERADWPISDSSFRGAAFKIQCHAGRLSFNPAQVSRRACSQAGK